MFQGLVAPIGSMWGFILKLKFKLEIEQYPSPLNTTPHNIIQIHKNVLWDSQYFAKKPLTFCLHDEMFCKILSVPQNIVMDMNNVMQFCGFFNLDPIFKP